MPKCFITERFLSSFRIALQKEIKLRILINSVTYISSHIRQGTFYKTYDNWHLYYRRGQNDILKFCRVLATVTWWHKCLLVPSPERKPTKSECDGRKLLVRKLSLLTLPILTLSNTNIPNSNSQTSFNFLSASPAKGKDFPLFPDAWFNKRWIPSPGFLQDCTLHQTNNVE